MSGKRSLLIAAMALAAAATASAPAAAGTGERAAAVRDCNHWAYYPNLKITSARNMTCRAARRDMRRRQGPIRRTFGTPGGFRCTRVSGGRLGGEWRCTKARKAYRFEFGD